MTGLRLQRLRKNDRGRDNGLEDSAFDARLESFDATRHAVTRPSIAVRGLESAAVFAKFVWQDRNGAEEVQPGSDALSPGSITVAFQIGLIEQQRSMGEIGWLPMGHRRDGRRLRKFRVGGGIRDKVSRFGG